MVRLPRQTIIPLRTELPVRDGHAMSKVVEFKDIGRIVARSRAGGRKVALCHGVFDLFHVGHLRHLSEGKRYADILVVSITADEYVNKGPDRPVFPAELRSE